MLHRRSSTQMGTGLARTDRRPALGSVANGVDFARDDYTTNHRLILRNTQYNAVMINTMAANITHFQIK